jgi:LAO/AO transport system kinase
MLDLGLGRAPDAWRPPIVATVATTGDGVAEVWDAIGRHRSWLSESGELPARRQRRLVLQLREVLIRRLEQDIDRLEGGQAYQDVRQEVIDRVTDPYTGAEALLAQLPRR